MVRPTEVAWVDEAQPERSGGQEAGEPSGEEPVVAGERRSVAPEQEVGTMRGQTGQPVGPEALGGRWAIDPAHSEIEFAIRHLMISTIKGRFNRFNGFITFARGQALPAAVEVEIEAASIDTGQEQRDIHLRSGDFFDVETYPTILFVSRRVEALSADHFRILGQLRLHGVTQPVTLEAIFLGIGRDPWGQLRASFTATTQIDRREFGLSWNRPLEGSGVMIGDMVSISLNIEAVKREEGIAEGEPGEGEHDA
jgi:polyisoprenoid-binding protein YceI